MYFCLILGDFFPFLVFFSLNCFSAPFFSQILRLSSWAAPAKRCSNFGYSSAFFSPIWFLFALFERKENRAVPHCRFLRLHKLSFCFFRLHFSNYTECKKQLVYIKAFHCTGHIVDNSVESVNNCKPGSHFRFSTGCEVFKYYVNILRFSEYNRITSGKTRNKCFSLF